MFHFVADLDNETQFRKLARRSIELLDKLLRSTGRVPAAQDAALVSAIYAGGPL